MFAAAFIQPFELNMKPNHEFYPKQGRVILHIDMNAFYCSVHEALEPEKYKGKPIGVAGSVELRKGIVVTSSYAARARGVKTGMQVREALKVCPELIIIQPNFDQYRLFSQSFMKIAYNYTPLLEATSIDECYLDITGSKQFGTPMEIANVIQTRVRHELNLPCSIGIAPNKLLAKMASDMQKPNGIVILRQRDVPKLLWDKPCNEMFGIGHKTAQKLLQLGIDNLGKLAAADETRLIGYFGVYGRWLKNAANGKDDSPVISLKTANKSIGHTTTLPLNLTEQHDIEHVFLNLADQVARRLRKQQLLAGTVQITIRNPRMMTITRSFTLPSPTEDAEIIYSECCKLFAKHWKTGNPVRLLGITLLNLTRKSDTALQLDLFDYAKHTKRENLTSLMDQIRDKYGESALITAGMLGNDPSSLIRNHKVRGTSLQKDD